METSERIVEAYVRYVKGWATIPNIKCKGQFEIDLLAIDPVTGRRSHIEVGVHTRSSFSRLTSKPFSRTAVKERVQAPKQRRTIGFFLERKFGPPEVTEKLAEYGFDGNNYERVIVSWGWTGAQAEAALHGVALWDFRRILKEITAACLGNTSYLADDTLRTLHLLSLAAEQGWGGPHLEGDQHDA